MIKKLILKESINLSIYMYIKNIALEYPEQKLTKL